MASLQMWSGKYEAAAAIRKETQPPPLRRRSAATVYFLTGPRTSLVLSFVLTKVLGANRLRTGDLVHTRLLISRCDSCVTAGTYFARQFYAIERNVI